MLRGELGSLIFLSTFTVVFMQCSYKIDQSDYVGCFTDDSNRLFPFVYNDIHFDNLTNQFCVLACLDSGFKYAGTQALKWCHCGNNPYTDIVTYPQLADSNCDTPCMGDNLQMCGGFWRLSMYKVGGFKSTESFQQYKNVYSGMALVDQPMSIFVIEEGKLESVMTCARFCGNATGCKVVSYSTTNSECRLYILVQLCNTVIDPSTSVYVLI